MKMNNVNVAVDKDEARYDYMIGISQVEKNKRREKFQRKQDEKANRKARGKMNRDSRKFRDAIDDDYDEY